MFTILSDFSIGEYTDNGDTLNPEPFYNKIHSVVDQKKIPYRRLQSGDEIVLDPLLTISVLNPRLPQTNNFGQNSVALKITYNNFSTLFMGDVYKDLEEEVANKAGQNTLLKIAEYGNSLTCSQEFLNKVQPEISVLEVLETPSYFLPSKETIARLEQSGSVVYRTDLNGTITVVTDGNTYTVKTER